MQQSKLQLRGDLIMLVVTLFWGASYLFMKIGLGDLGAFTLITLRFGIAFLLAALIFYKRMLKTTWQMIKHSAILGSVLFLALAVVTLGVRSTSASNSGFLFSLAVLFVPLLLTLLYKRKLAIHVSIGVGLCFIGICFMTMINGVHIHIGDLLIILGALLYAIYILITDKVATKSDALALGIWQLGFTALFAVVCAFLFETPHLPQTTSSWFAVLALGILCSGCGFIGQTVAQQYTTPMRTGLIFSLEPVFTIIFSYFFLHEILSVQGYIGASFMLVGVILSKVGFPKWKVAKQLS